MTSTPRPIDAASASADTDERALLDRLDRRDLAALARLYDLHAPAAFGLARHLLPTDDDAADVVLDAFLALWRCPPSPRHERSVRAHLLALVYLVYLGYGADRAR